jgi:hypothetical protein
MGGCFAGTNRERAFIVQASERTTLRRYLVDVLYALSNVCKAGMHKQIKMRLILAAELLRK